MRELCLVTGANGHLGNTVVRALLDQGYRVRAGVRGTSHAASFAGLDCEVVQAELLDEFAMGQALQGVDVLFQVAAVFKHWARNPQAEIIEPNVEGTRRVLQAASKAGVKRVVYVSSVAAVGHNGQALNEEQWNDEGQNAYYASKILSEKIAWRTAKALNLWMVSVLPSAMVGPNATKLTDTMAFVDAIRRRQVALDPGFHFNFVDVRDVAQGMIRAAQTGRSGQRYILANEHCSSLAEVTQALNRVTPGNRQPASAPKWLLLGVAWIQEWRARLSGQPARLLLSQVRMFHGVKQEYSIAKARSELGFNPRTPDEALQSAFRFLETRSSAAQGPIESEH